MTLINLIAISFLCVITFQDFKERKIYSFLPVIVFALFFLRTYIAVGIDNTLIFSFTNLMIVVTQIIFLFAYFSIKNKKPVNIVDNKIGLGDLLFFVAICPLFSVYNFIVFFIVSFFISIAFHLIKKGTVPLAGILSGVLVFVLSFSMINKEFNITSDISLISSFESLFV